MYKCNHHLRGCLKVQVNRVGEPLRISVGVVCDTNQDFNEWYLLVDEGYLLVDGENGVQRVLVNKK